MDLVGTNNPESENAWKHELLRTVEAGLVHDIVVPILKGKAGSVHIGISEHRIQRTISHFTMALVAIAGFVLLVAVGLAMWQLSQGFRPVVIFP